jgi:hypothetical protein
MRKHLNPFGRYHFDLDRMGARLAAATGSGPRPSSCALSGIFGRMWLVPVLPVDGLSGQIATA